MMCGDIYDFRSGNNDMHPYENYRFYHHWYVRLSDLILLMYVRTCCALADCQFSLKHLNGIRRIVKEKNRPK